MLLEKRHTNELCVRTAPGAPGVVGGPGGAGGGTDIGKWLLELNDVDLHEKIGQGAYGAVFRATLRSRDAPPREVAVKKLSFRDEDEAGEQRKEVLLMSRFTHPNIVQFLGACLDGHELHIVTEFCSRGNLSHCLKAGEIDWNTKLRLAYVLLFLHSGFLAFLLSFYADRCLQVRRSARYGVPARPPSAHRAPRPQVAQPARRSRLEL